MDEDQEWLAAVFDDLMRELEIEEAKAWRDGLSQSPDAESAPKNSAEKEKGPAMPTPSLVPVERERD